MTVDAQIPACRRTLWRVTWSHPSIVLSEPPRLIGHVVYYMTYYSNEGRAVYMDDLYVTPEFRKKGIGKALMKKVAQVYCEDAEGKIREIA